MSGEESGKKRKVIGELFERLYRPEERVDVIPFNNQVIGELGVKYGFANLFDATKFDKPEVLPQIMQKEGWFVMHLGGGNHAFVRGEGYHRLEPVHEVNEIKRRGSVLDSIGKSEAGALSALYNEGIVQDFLLGKRDAPLGIHTSRRSKFSFTFRVGKHTLKANGLQLEVDAFFEGEKVIAAVEAKMGRGTHFEIRQLFTALRYLKSSQSDGKIPTSYAIRFLYSTRFLEGGRDRFNLWEYQWQDPMELNSIKFVRAVGYMLTGGS